MSGTRERRWIDDRLSLQIQRAVARIHVYPRRSVGGDQPPQPGLVLRRPRRDMGSDPGTKPLLEHPIAHERPELRQRQPLLGQRGAEGSLAREIAFDLGQRLLNIGRRHHDSELTRACPEHVPADEPSEIALLELSCERALAGLLGSLRELGARFEPIESGSDIPGRDLVARHHRSWGGQDAAASAEDQSGPQRGDHAPHRD